MPCFQVLYGDDVDGLSSLALGQIANPIIGNCFCYVYLKILKRVMVSPSISDHLFMFFTSFPNGTHRHASLSSFTAIAEPDQLDIQMLFVVISTTYSVVPLPSCAFN